MPRWVKQASNSKKGLTISTTIVFAVLFQAGQLAADYENWDGIKDAGIPGYTEDDWNKSSIVQFIRNNRRVFGFEIVYSDANDAFYFYTGLPCKFLPHKESARELQQFKNDPEKWIVWFNAGENADLIDLKYLQENENLTLAWKFEDGAIYYISKGPVRIPK